MARTQHLPLYQSVFAYTREMYRLRVGFPRSVKHDLGKEICDSSIKLLKCVVLANSASQKEPHLTRLVLEVEVQWMLLRLLYELRAVSGGQFKLLSERLSDITKQSQAWLKWVRVHEGKKTSPIKKSLVEMGQTTSKDNCNWSGHFLKKLVAKRFQLTEFGETFVQRKLFFRERNKGCL